MKTFLCNFDPLKCHFYIEKMGFTGVYIIFLRIFIWKFSVLVVKFSIYLNRHVFVILFRNAVLTVSKSSAMSSYALNILFLRTQLFDCWVLLQKSPFLRLLTWAFVPAKSCLPGIDQFHRITKSRNNKTIYMNCQSLFPGKNEKNVLKCCLLKFIFSMLSAKKGAFEFYNKPLLESLEIL